MWDQTRNRKPMMNGYATFARPGFSADAQLLGDPASRPPPSRACAPSGVRYVVLDRNPAMPAALPPPYALRYADPAVQVYTLPP